MHASGYHESNVCVSGCGACNASNPHLSQIILPECGNNTRMLNACRCVDKRVAEKDVAVLGTSGLPGVWLELISR